MKTTCSQSIMTQIGYLFALADKIQAEFAVFESISDVRNYSSTMTKSGTWRTRMSNRKSVIPGGQC
jgi:hypothetical protein